LNNYAGAVVVDFTLCSVEALGELVSSAGVVLLSPAGVELSAGVESSAGFGGAKGLPMTATPSESIFGVASVSTPSVAAGVEIPAGVEDFSGSWVPGFPVVASTGFATGETSGSPLRADAVADSVDVAGVDDSLLELASVVASLPGFAPVDVSGLEPPVVDASGIDVVDDMVEGSVDTAVD